MNKTPITAIITTSIAVLGFAGAAYSWDVSQRKADHDFILTSAKESSIDLDLRLIEVELKQFRAIEETRELTADEKERIEYLKLRREILLQSRKS